MINLLSADLVSVLSGFFGPVLYLIVLNGFGVLAIGCKVCEYQVKKRDVMLIIATIANVLWVLYFVFYGDLASALTCFIGVVRLLVFMQKGKHKWAESSIWLVLFLILQVAVAIFTYKVWKDLISLTAGFVGIFAYFVASPKKYRYLSFVYMSLWVVNGIIKFYPVALISDTMSLISVTVAIVRFSIMEKRQKKQESKVTELD